MQFFVKYLRHFIKYVHPSETNPCLMVLDGHCSHKSLEVITVAKENHITLITIPPHTSHRLQPLDVTFFGPLKSRYSREVDKWMIKNPGKRLTDYELAELFAGAYESTASVAVAKNGFEKTGIYPYNPDVFNDEDFIASAVTEMPDPSVQCDNNIQVDINEESTGTGISDGLTSCSPPAAATSADIHVDLHRDRPTLPVTGDATHTQPMLNSAKRAAAMNAKRVSKTKALQSYCTSRRPRLEGSVSVSRIQDSSANVSLKSGRRGSVKLNKKEVYNKQAEGICVSY